jgi:hypothetical protein
MGYGFGLLPGQRRIGDYVVSVADRQQCPVCGHLTGDCTGDSEKPDHIWGLGTVPSMRNSQTILVEENIYEERQITPFTKSKVLVAAKGKRISLDLAEELGLI